MLVFVSSALDTSAATTILSALAVRRGSQVVRSRSAKPLFAGSIPAPASRSRSVSLNNEISFHAPVRLIRRRPTAHPYGLRPMSLGSRRLHSRPRLKVSLGFVEQRDFTPRAGSIGSLSPDSSPLRASSYVARVPAGSIPAPAYLMEMINSGNTSDNALVTQANACVLQLVRRLTRRCTRCLLCSMLDPTVSYDGRSAVKRRRGFRWEKRS